MSETPNKIYLSENELPKAWYNLRADMKTQHAPLRNPATLEPITDPAQLSPIFCEELAKQELNTTDRFIELPEEIYEYYKLYRPSPLIRAYNLEKELGTPAKIFYKFEGN
ncbi:MAG TPA: TrpB-like pyridoxal-phosphate dependent enzyme, partial [Oscillospiraceae bacterium]|nr:TrpB-like pyridoxal-phosphate dependent enzyme [Oscillospiraceae bacterium]